VPRAARIVRFTLIVRDSEPMTQLSAERVRNVLDYSNARDFPQRRQSFGRSSDSQCLFCFLTMRRPRSGISLSGPAIVALVSRRIVSAHGCALPAKTCWGNPGTDLEPICRVF